MNAARSSLVLYEEYDEVEAEAFAAVSGCAAGLSVRGIVEDEDGAGDRTLLLRVSR